jgi:hypothetical protein
MKIEWSNEDENVMNVNTTLKGHETDPMGVSPPITL